MKRILVSLAPITTHETSFNVKSNIKISFPQKIPVFKVGKLKNFNSEMEQPDFDAERNESIRRAKPQVSRQDKITRKCKNNLQLFITKSFSAKKS